MQSTQSRGEGGGGRAAAAAAEADVAEGGSQGVVGPSKGDEAALASRRPAG